MSKNFKTPKNFEKISEKNGLRLHTRTPFWQRAWKTSDLTKKSFGLSRWCPEIQWDFEGIWHKSRTLSLSSLFISLSRSVTLCLPLSLSLSESKQGGGCEGNWSVQTVDWKVTRQTFTSIIKINMLSDYIKNKIVINQEIKNFPSFFLWVNGV